MDKHGNFSDDSGRAALSAAVVGYARRTIDARSGAEDEDAK
jgi:hypothetical protein